MSSVIRLAMVFAFVFAPLRGYPDQTVSRIFTLNYMSVEEAEEAIRALLSEAGRMSSHPSTNTLIVRDSPSSVAAIEGILKELDKKPAQVRIKVRFVEESELNKLGIEVNWRLRDDDWSIGNVFAPEGKGLNLRATLGHEEKGVEGFSVQNILVMSGKKASIRRGASIPYVDWFYHYSRRHGYLTSELRFKEVVTGFVVGPRVRGEDISVEITPEVSYLSDKGDGQVVFKRLSTVLMVKNKEDVVIGGGRAETDSLVTRILGGMEISDKKENFYMVLTAEIE